MNKFTFKRHEVKYIITQAQYEIIVNEISKYLSLDQYGEVTIQSLYYDTDTFRLIRNSIESPDYKEKIRLRSYGLATPDKTVFLELKKKVNKIVFKRRIEIKEKDVEDFIKKGKDNPIQIEKEILYFINYYKNLMPRMLLLYDRSAYTCSYSDLRITFDKNPRYRTTDLNICTSLDGISLLPDGKILMEIKTSLGYPIWLVKLLNENKIYKTSFSKYGAAYKNEFNIKKYQKKEEYWYV